MTEEEKIAKILKDGHMIADKIKAAQTFSVHCTGLEKTLQPENYDNEATNQLAERYMTDYIEFLDSRKWAVSSYGKKLQ